MTDTAKQFRREIDLGDGSGVQVFEADTAEELVDKLADAQANATKKIRELNETNKKLQRRVLTQPDSGGADPDGPVMEFNPRELSNDELFALGQRLQNPATAAAALREGLEAGLGASLDQVRRVLQTSANLPRQLRGRDAAETFLNAHPEFVTSKANSDAMFEYMTSKKMALTTENFEIAYGALSERGLLQLRAPAGTGGAPGNGTGSGNGNGGTGAADSANGSGVRVERPRFASTSIASRSSGTPRGGTSSKMPTAEEIDRMSAKEHARWLKTPGFMEHEDRVMAARVRR